MCIKYIFFVVYCNLHLSFSSSLIWLNKIMREKNWKTNTSKNLVRLLLFHTLVTFARCKLLNERKIEMKWNEKKNRKANKQGIDIKISVHERERALAHTNSLARARTHRSLFVYFSLCMYNSISSSFALPLSLSLSGCVRVWVFLYVCVQCECVSARMC